jgi:uncharacterized protein YndB with AHSA1/START domain
MEDRFDAGIDAVWSALTEPGRLARWIAEVEGDLRPGGVFRARYIDGGWEGTGVVDACAPPRRLLLTMRDADPRPGQPEQSVVEAELAAAGGHTTLIVEERGLPLDLLAAYATGLQIHLENLAAHIAGREPLDESRWEELLPAYRQLAARTLAGDD